MNQSNSPYPAMFQYKMKRAKSLGWIQHYKHKMLSTVTRQSVLTASDTTAENCDDSDDVGVVNPSVESSDSANNINNSVPSSAIQVLNVQHPGNNVSKSMPSSPCTSFHPPHHHSPSGALLLHSPLQLQRQTVRQSNSTDLHHHDLTHR